MIKAAGSWAGGPGWKPGPVPPAGRALYSALGAGGPPEAAELRLLVLEDLQWADADTLAVVECLADNLGSEPAALVVTLRLEEGDALVIAHPFDDDRHRGDSSAGVMGRSRWKLAKARRAIMSREPESVDAGFSHVADHADVEHRHVDDHVRVSERHLDARRILYLRHADEHNALADRHIADHDKAADAPLGQRLVLSTRHAAQHALLEARHATQLAWLDIRNAAERVGMDGRHAAELVAQERRHAAEDRELGRI